MTSALSAILGLFFSGETSAAFGVPASHPVSTEVSDDPAVTAAHPLALFIALQKYEPPESGSRLRSDESHDQ